jgi:hypothetical protein
MEINKPAAMEIIEKDRVHNICNERLVLKNIKTTLDSRTRVW